MHSRYFEREATALINRERVEVIGAVVEALRAELRDDYRALGKDVDPMSKQQIVHAVAAVVDHQSVLRDR